MAKKRQTQAEKVANIPYESIAKLSGEAGKKQLQKHVRTLQAGYRRRVQSFKRKGLISHAQISLESSIPDTKPVQLTKLSWHQLQMEFVRYSKFFQDKTSTESGIKEVNLEQDIRIFGKDKKGRPKATMTAGQREKFWSLYDEFINYKPLLASQAYSEQTQQMIADALFNDGIDSDNIVNFLDAVEEKVFNATISGGVENAPNVFSGRGNIKL